MNRTLIIAILSLSLSIKAKADHITGGEIFYTYIPGANGTNKYDCTFKLFMRCNSNRQFNNPTIVSIFDRSTNRRVTDISVSLQSSETISINNSDPCITNPPQVCYVVGYYNFVVTLPESPAGYTISSQVNYRIAGIDNLQNGYSNIGATYTAEIPGTDDPTGPKNNSARFTGSDLVVVCADNRFAYSFAATDNDGDQLRYSFCSAFRSGSGGNMVSPPPEPPYIELPYGNSFTGSTPLGVNVQINPVTGLITGTAPDAGIYVVTVCVEEIRNGKLIAHQRKDLQINIAACNIAAAQLHPDYMLCGDSKTLYLTNLSTSPLIHTYLWKLSDRSGTFFFTSTEKTPSYTFVDTGSYFIHLLINQGEACTDSTTSVVRVYPGFEPKFSYKGICFNKPTAFTDATTTVYGQVNAWNWTFGTGEISEEQNPVYIYTTAAVRYVQLIVQNTVGCRDTVINSVPIVTAPPINLAFKDTLVCLGDPVTLRAQGSGNFTWSPVVNTVNPNTPAPTVTPSATTTYFVNLDDNGCVNNDSVRVRITDHVNLQLMADTTICAGDTVQLRIISDAFTYSWTPANQLTDPGASSPYAVTTVTTGYNVTANIGSCEARSGLTVSTVPYPFAEAGNDTVICYNTSARLSGRSDGQIIKWTPEFSLDDPNLLRPVANPRSTTRYQLSAYDTRGCPKAGSDTVLVKVLPLIAAFAGNDTSVIVDQPLQLKATGGTGYLWSPAIGLSDPTIANPVAGYNEPFVGITYKTIVFNEAGCTDSDYVTVKVFNTGPSVFVPTAFTPNSDGKNDILRPIAAGIMQIETFSIYNRWGQLVFKSNVSGKGWDGTIGGVAQPSGVYVWLVKATDYNGRPYSKKGTVTLIK